MSKRKYSYLQVVFCWVWLDALGNRRFKRRIQARVDAADAARKEGQYRFLIGTSDWSR